MTNSTSTDRQDARAMYRNVRRTMATAIMACTGARLDDEATIHADHIVIGGDRAQCEIARAHFADVLKVDGVTIDADVIPDDPEWTCLRIPESGLDAAIARSKARA
jgi:hypothetical protein